MAAPLHVRALHGEVMTYEVESVSQPGLRHRVDLLANHGFGVCTCVDHWKRRQPLLNQLTPAERNARGPIPEKLTCKHVRAAHAEFLRDLLRTMADQQDGKRRRPAPVPPSRTRAPESGRVDASRSTTKGDVSPASSSTKHSPVPPRAGRSPIGGSPLPERAGARSRSA